MTGLRAYLSVLRRYLLEYRYSSTGTQHTECAEFEHRMVVEGSSCFSRGHSAEPAINQFVYSTETLVHTCCACVCLNVEYGIVCRVYRRSASPPPISSLPANCCALLLLPVITTRARSIFLRFAASSSCSIIDQRPTAAVKTNPYLETPPLLRLTIIRIKRQQQQEQQ